MSLEQKKGRERLAAPRPSKTLVSSAVVEPENLKEAKLLNEQEEYNAASGETEAPQDKKSGFSKKPMIGALTDVDAIRDYLTRIQAEPRSLKTAVISEQEGKYRRDIATVHFEKDGTVSVKLAYHAAAGTDVETLAPTDVEAAEIKAEVAGYEWPSPKKAYALAGAPDEITKAASENVFRFEAADGGIIMIQVRKDTDDGKIYVPWTYWSDDKWRCAEPEGPLPLYNAHRLREASTVFIHEGAKAARYAQWMVDGKSEEAKAALEAHPWGAKLANAVHVGWIGGAKAPRRTDWAPLKAPGIKMVYVVADHDDDGIGAVPEISEAIWKPTFLVQFTDEFPSGFDLADEFPKEKYTDGFWTGPAFEACVHPATFATYQVPHPEVKGRSITHLRPSFKGQWKWVSSIERFVFERNPSIRESSDALNTRLRSFSHVKDTAQLMLQEDFYGVIENICYRPETEERRLTVDHKAALNVYRKPKVERLPGDPKPFLDFLAYLFPKVEERREVERWIATLIARPGTRMRYALLLVSATQGTGKTTLGAGILAPLVGEENVKYPNENEMIGAFNGYLAHRRLAIVHEIYQGSSWKAYHALKPAITEKEVTVNEKYEKQYTIENWCHIFACSNSLQALKMENDDRRWFYPEVSEDPWPKEKFDALRRWIQGRGLGIISNWAHGYGDYVAEGDRAPMTARKRELINESRSEAQVEATALAQGLTEMGVPSALGLNDVHAFLAQRVQGKIFDTKLDIRKAMVSAGARAFEGEPSTVKIGGYHQYLSLIHI